MNQLKKYYIYCRNYFRRWSYKIVKFLRRISDYFDEDLRKERELEQQRRHQEFEAYMKKYLECVEKARAEDN